jgi:hypothetical protein
MSTRIAGAYTMTPEEIAAANAAVARALADLDRARFGARDAGDVASVEEVEALIESL